MWWEDINFDTAKLRIFSLHTCTLSLSSLLIESIVKYLSDSINLDISSPHSQTGKPRWEMCVHHTALSRLRCVLTCRKINEKCEKCQINFQFPLTNSRRWHAANDWLLKYLKLVDCGEKVNRHIGTKRRNHIESRWFIILSVNSIEYLSYLCCRCMTMVDFIPMKLTTSKFHISSSHIHHRCLWLRSASVLTNFWQFEAFSMQHSSKADSE